MSVVVNEHGEPQYKVMIAVPCQDEVKAMFALDLALMLAYTTYYRPEMTVRVSFLKGTYIDRARARLVNEAAAIDATHILWLDSDMRFPKETLIRLLGHNKPVVGCNYPTRTPPILPTATHGVGDYQFTERPDVYEVRHAGMGVMLVSMAVFREIGKPYFVVGYDRVHDDYAGEDTFFCERARQKGFAIWMDGPLSEEVRHLGSFEFGMPHARMTEEAARESRHVRESTD